MDDLNSLVRRVTRVAVWTLSLSFLVWALVPSFRHYAAGFILGMIAGLLNTRYLSVKIKQLTELVVRRDRKRFNLGFLTRAAVALLAVMFAVKWGQADVVSVIVGLFFTQLATLLIGFLSLQRKS
jgi:ATP synthase protein I